MATRLKRGHRYRVGDTGFTIEIHPWIKGYLVRCGEKKVAERSTRKAALNWAKRNAGTCKR